MKKITLLLFTSFFLSITINAQKNGVDPNYRFYYKETSFETDDYKIYIEDPIAVDGWSKFKVRIFNKTNDYIIFKPTEVEFKINGQVIPCKDKQISVPPNDEATKVIDVKGKNLQVDTFSVIIKKVFKGAANSAPFVVNDYEIPLSTKDFKAGKFFCKTKGAVIKTDKTLLKFLCTYEGDDLGILMPSHVTAIMPRGQENTNSNRNKGTLLDKGKSDDFIVEFKEMKGAGDMQKEHFVLKWNDTFKETKVEVLSGGEFKLELDRAKTAEKNK